jgi:hypothetical protein
MDNLEHENVFNSLNGSFKIHTLALNFGCPISGDSIV